MICETSIREIAVKSLVRLKHAKMIFSEFAQNFRPTMKLKFRTFFKYLNFDFLENLTNYRKLNR